MKKLLALILSLAFAAHVSAATSFIPYSKPEFETSIRKQDPVIVHVYADWCPTCQKQVPSLIQAINQPELSKVKAFRVNFDTDREFLMTHRVPNQSVILLFKDGQEVLRLNGVTNADQISTKIKAAL